MKLIHQTRFSACPLETEGRRYMCHFHLQAFAKEGAQVTATDINPEKLKELDAIPGLVFVDFAATCWGK